MATLVTQRKPTNQIKAYVKDITVAWRNALDGILEAGRLLKEAHQRLDDKAWNRMINNDLPFTRCTAEKLIKIANDKRLTSRKHQKYLPPRWTTLHELTYLTDDEFQGAIKVGTIHPDLERKEAKELAAVNKRRAKANSTPVKIRKSADPDVEKSTQLFIDDDPDDQLAVIKAGRDLSDEEATRLEDGLNELAEKFGLTFTYSGYSSEKVAKKGMRGNLAKAQQRWLSSRNGHYNKRGEILRELGPEPKSQGPVGETMEPDEILVLEEAIRQLEGSKNFRKSNGDGFHPHDVRNPDNPYHEWYLAKKDKDVDWDPAEMYDFCERNRIITKFTPMKFVDYLGYLKFLVFSHSVSSEKRRIEVEAELKGLIEQEQKIQGAEIEADRLQAEGSSLGDVVAVLPAVDTPFRGVEIDKFSSIEPGRAKAALELLVR